MSQFPGTEDVDPRQVFAGPGYLSPPASDNGVANVGLFLSVFAALLFPLLPVSLTLGIVGWVRARGLHGAGLRAARGATVVSLVFIVVWLTMWGLAQIL